MTAVVKCDHLVEARAHILHARDFGEEGGELPHALFERMDAFQRFRLFLEKLREMMSDHGGAGAGGHHNVLGLVEDFEEVAGYGARFGTISTIKSGLAAA